MGPKVFTVYDTDNNEFTKVEEPDPSLSYTYADYLKWNFEERLELIRGRIFKMSPAPAPVHQKIAGNLTGIFYNALKNKKCGMYPAPFDVRLPLTNKNKDSEVNTVVQPDISIICDESKIDARGCCGAPDLVAEILSPGNSHKEVKLKFDLYEEAGIKEYWVVNPAEENLIIFLLDDQGKYPGGKMYAGKEKIESKAIPGLIIITEEIFTK
jgi:Uma2 family endonuclease